MKLKRIAATGIAALAVPAVALAASGPTMKASVSPNTPKAKSTLKVSAKGPFNQTGLPISLQLNLQKGFATSAKSVTQLCPVPAPPSGDPGCPAASQIGSGTAHISFMGSTQPLGITLYLGKKQQPGDIASVVLSETVGMNQANATGRLFKTSTGQIEILFDSLPLGGAPPTLDDIKFSAHAVNGKNSLVKNPSSCPSSHHWSGKFTLGFTSGNVSKKLKIACKA